jgi:hypothetical protein
MTRVSSPAHNPFATSSEVDGVEPYVSSPSARGAIYTVPSGYRHDFERSWLLPSRSVALVLLGVAALMFYLRSDHLLPLLMGTTVTRVPVVESAASAVNPWTGQAHWGKVARSDAFPLDFPANLPPTAAGPVTRAARGVHKCVQADGSVVYQQQSDCSGRSESADHATSGTR